MVEAKGAEAAVAATVSDFNPIAWGQFQLRGGWRSFWATVIGYGAVVGAGMVLVARLSEGTPQALAGLKSTFTGLQAGLMIIFVSTRVSTAIRQDQTSRMLESHRLMPVSPAQAVLGYLVGPAVGPLGICAANVLLGWGLCSIVGTPLELWLTLNAILVGFATFAVVLAAFGGLAGRPGAVAVGWIAMFVGMVNFFTIGSILPAVNVLATPVLGSTVFDLSVAGADAVEKYAPSTLFQAWIAAVCFAGACRKYRREDRPALGWDLGLLMLAGWVATSFAGIMYWDHFQPSVVRGRRTDPAYQVIGSMVAAMLLALVPLAGAAWSSRQSAPRHSPPVALVALFAAGITLLLALSAPRPMREDQVDAVARTGLILAAFYLATAYVLRVLIRVTDKLLYPLLVWLIVAWLVPLAVDYGLWWTRGEYDQSMIGAASCFGALGAVIQIWTGGALPVTTPGIAWQVFLAAAAAAAFYASESRWRRRGG
jgi:hypothetical protein